MKYYKVEDNSTVVISFLVINTEKLMNSLYLLRFHGGKVGWSIHEFAHVLICFSSFFFAVS